jgi:hypothetical protein
VLEELALASDSKVSAKRGKRQKKHITNLTRNLVSLWCKAGQDFKKNFRRAKGKNGLEFDSPGPQFVWRIMSAMDPSITIDEARAALKRIDSKKPQKSEKPGSK